VKVIDLRSDTVTKPTEEMREAMARAEVGNEAYGEDPTILELEKLAVELTGMEAALFVASGKQGNLSSVLAHCRRDDGVCVGKESHIYFHEGRGVVTLSGVQLLFTDDSKGIPAPENIFHVTDKANCRHAPPKLLCLENTHNFAGGLAVPPDIFKRAVDAARDVGLKVHLDGARIFDAVAKWGIDVKNYTEIVDSVQICLTKTLAAPLGSIVCGSKEFIKEARSWRNRLGGSFRQAGIVGAAGLISLNKMRLRLLEDHKRAEYFRNKLKEAGLDVQMHDWSTNMVFINFDKEVNFDKMEKLCKSNNVLIGFTSLKRMRLVVHNDIDNNDLDFASGIIPQAIYSVLKNS